MDTNERCVLCNSIVCESWLFTNISMSRSVRRSWVHGCQGHAPSDRLAPPPLGLLPTLLGNPGFVTVKVSQELLSFTPWWWLIDYLQWLTRIRTWSIQYPSGGIPRLTDNQDERYSLLTTSIFTEVHRVWASGQLKPLRQNEVTVLSTCIEEGSRAAAADYITRKQIPIYHCFVRENPVISSHRHQGRCRSLSAVSGRNGGRAGRLGWWWYPVVSSRIHI